MIHHEHSTIFRTSIYELMKKFDNSDQTVKSFNTIFNLSPIKFNDKEKVKIGHVINNTQRIVYVNDRAIRVELKGATVVNKPNKLKYVNGKATKESKRTGLPKPENPTVDDSLFLLHGSVFKIYVFIKTYGPIAGSSFIAEKLNLSERSLRTFTKELEDLNLIKKNPRSIIKIYEAINNDKA